MESKSISGKRIRILMIDDSETVRAALAGLIGMEPDMMVCGEARDGETGLGLARKQKPDVILLDLSLDNWQGEKILRELKRLTECPVLVVSMHDEMVHGVRTLKAGARGYLMKQDAADRIIPAIRQVSDGKLYCSKNLASRLGPNFKFMDGKEAA